MNMDPRGRPPITVDVGRDGNVAGLAEMSVYLLAGGRAE